jgi:hypothetical protein
MASMVMASMKKKHKNPKPPKYMTLSQKYLRFALFGLLAINPLEAQASDTSSPTYLQQMYEWITKDPNKEPVNKETNADSRDTNKDTSNDIKNGTKVVETKASDNTASSAFYGINNHGKSLTTPVAWGASNNVIYMGVGGTIPAPYTNESDAAAEVGIGLGDTQKNLGVQLSLVSLDMSQWDRYSLYLHLSKDIDNASAIGAGIENIMLSAGGDAEKSFYVVYSHGIQSDPFVNKESGDSKLYYSIGAGSGRFGDKSPDDIFSGKGAHGTYVFGNVAYEVAGAFNVIAEWNGLNLNAGLSKTFWIAGVPLSTVIGAADLTSNSGDGVRGIFALGTGFKL